MVFSNSYDNKIMNWDRKDFDELVSSMTNKEIEDMVIDLQNMDPFDIDSDYFEDYNGEYIKKYVVYDYIKRWFFLQIEKRTISGTRELFETVMAMV